MRRPLRISLPSEAKWMALRLLLFCCLSSLGRCHTIIIRARKGTGRFLYICSRDLIVILLCLSFLAALLCHSMQCKKEWKNPIIFQMCFHSLLILWNVISAWNLLRSPMIFVVVDWVCLSKTELRSVLCNLIHSHVCTIYTSHPMHSLALHSSHSDHSHRRHLLLGGAASLLLISSTQLYYHILVHESWLTQEPERSMRRRPNPKWNNANGSFLLVVHSSGLPFQLHRRVVIHRHQIVILGINYKSSTTAKHCTPGLIWCVFATNWKRNSIPS